MRLAKVLAIALWAIAALSWPALVMAQNQSAPSSPGGMIDIAYDDAPPPLRTIAADLKNARTLEQAQQFLSPLVLKKRLLLKAASCDGHSFRPYQADGPVTLCYEYVQQVLATLPKSGDDGVLGTMVVSRSAMIAGPIVEEVLHDVALAVFDIQEVPVWGRAEFAADNVAAFLMLQFGTDVAMKSILGTARFLNTTENSISYSVAYLGDIRPTVRQRYYDLLCIAYGSDDVKFGMFTAYNRPALVADLPNGRLQNCKDEYAQLKSAFVRTIMPLVNLDRAKEVLAQKWLAD
jgi:hypothetical protein